MAVEGPDAHQADPEAPATGRPTDAGNAGQSPGQIDVDVREGPGAPARKVSVLIDRSEERGKAFLGGYRRAEGGAVYHHAASQTEREGSGGAVERKLCRETQTVDTKTRGSQSQREAFTQMERPGLLLDDGGDVVVMPGVYVDSKQVACAQESAAVMIQRFARGAAARRRARRLRKLKQERDEFAGELERQQQHEQEEKRKYAVNRRMHPRTQEDFDLLHEELEAWRVQETRKIKDRGMDSEEELAALQQLLHKETKLLQTIDRLKNVADTENREMHVHATLSRMSEPKSWDLSNGAKVLVHTPFTTRAKQMMQLYFATTLPLVSIEERMDVLLHVKWTAKEYDCELTRQLVNLIDREADLLNRGRNQKTLEGLRKRISNTLLDFIETPEFNPEASRFVIAKEKPDAYIYAHVGSATSLEQTWKKPLYSTI